MPPSSCPSGKYRYPAESDALDGLSRVRAIRLQTPERTRPPENHIYPCERCHGYHLSSTAPRPEPPVEQGRSETVENYTVRLERRIAQQRAEILSLLATGNGMTNRESRRRIESLTIALARVTELWQREVRNREALVEKLHARRWWRR